jgi:hypothetical protein
MQSIQQASTKETTRARVCDVSGRAFDEEKRASMRLCGLFLLCWKRRRVSGMAFALKESCLKQKISAGAIVGEHLTVSGSVSLSLKSLAL